MNPIQQQPLPDKTADHLALASLILSVCFVVIGPFGSIAGIVCGKMAQKKMRFLPPPQDDGLAKAGIIIGWIGVALTVLVVLLFLLFFAFAFSVG